MSYKQKSRGLPYVQKIDFDNNSKRIRRKSPKLCSECKETNDCVKLVSSKMGRIEEIINNFDKNFSIKNVAQFSKFNAKFTLNNIPCELECNLSNFTLENLKKLVNITTQICNNNNNPSDKNSSNESSDYFE